jgi:hypothetical protein
MNSNVDILRLIFQVRAENDVSEPLSTGANPIERLAQEGIVEHQLAHLLFVILIRPKTTE